MPDPEDTDLFKDIQMGELNELGFDPESPLITNSFDGEALFSGMFTKFMERDSLFDSKTPKKGIVLLATSFQTSGVILESRFPELAPLQKVIKASGMLGNTRNFAVVRIPEIHGHIPSPSLPSLVQASTSDLEGRALPDDQKMLLSMHDMCFSAPIKILGDMPSLNPGDIVLVDSDGLITKLIEPAEMGIWGKITGTIASALNFAGNAVGLDGRGPSTEQSPYGLRYYATEEPPEYIGVMVHYTVTKDIDGAVAVLGNRGLSYHYVVDKDGSYETLIDPEAGASLHGGNSNMEYIGISLVNLGFDAEGAASVGVSTDNWERLTPGPEGLWEPYPAAKIAGFANLVSELKYKFPTITYIAGHEDQSGSKADPGPMFDRAGGWEVTGLERGTWEPSVKNRSVDSQIIETDQVPGN